MNRRSALKNTAILGLSAPFFLKAEILKQEGNPEKTLSSYHKFRLGDLELVVISDGHILFDKIQPSFAPGIASDKVIKALEDNFLPSEKVDLAINILVVKNSQKTILIDCGCGFNFGDASGWLPKNLSAAGIRPENITDIVLTHAHPDHLGGLLNKDDTLVFPHANIHLSQIENNFWMGTSPDFSKSRVNASLAGMVTNIARHTITTIKPKLNFFNDGDTLFNCMRLVLAPGHTPGHTIVNIFSKSEELVHVADLVHSSALVVAHPDWGFEGDTDFDLAIKSRKKVLKELAENRKLIFSYHLPWPGLGHVRQKDDGFDWVQTTFSVPD